MRAYSRAKNSKYSNLQLWVGNHNTLVTTGVNNFLNKACRPKIFVQNDVSKISTELTNAELTQNTPTEAKFREICRNVRLARRRSLYLSEVVAEPSKSTYGRLKKAINPEKRKIQLKTPARIIMESDPRNPHSMLDMARACCEKLDPNMIFNSENTQYVIVKDANDKYVCVKLEGNATITAPGSGKWVLAVKYYHLHNANWYSAELLIVIADDSMN